VNTQWQWISLPHAKRLNGRFVRQDGELSAYTGAREAACRPVGSIAAGLEACGDAVTGQVRWNERQTEQLVITKKRLRLPLVPREASSGFSEARHSIQLWNNRRQLVNSGRPPKQVAMELDLVRTDDQGSGLSRTGTGGPNQVEDEQSVAERPQSGR
jgi:hypothetical protein